MEKPLMIRRGRIEIDISHLDIDNNGMPISFVLPGEGPGRYQVVMDKITKRDLLRPTTAQTISLIYDLIQNTDEPECKEIIRTLNNGYLWTSTENLWIRKKGVYVYDNIDGNMPSDKKSLEKMLKEGDKRVRFAPLDFKQGRNQTTSELANNPYLLAHAGEEGVQKFIQIADKLKNNPKIFSFRRYTHKNTNYTSLRCEKFDEEDNWLSLNGRLSHNDFDGYTFGVIDRTEAP